jgi:hypothetical protein
MPHDNYGIFEPAFKGTRYLSLLHLASEDSAEVVSLVVNLARSSPHPYEETNVLLEDRNWRPHLVGGVALCALSYDVGAFSKLWRAIDTGSWVTPQLVVVAFMRDPNFVREATSRLEKLCPVDPSPLLQMDPLERHSAAGPAGSRHRSAKAAASLFRLLQSKAAAPSTGLGGNDELQKLIQDDFDNSGGIAEEWLERITSLLSS